MSNEEVVNEAPVETTIDTDSTPVETETTEIVEQTPASESAQPTRVSDAVPYDRFKEVNDEVRALKEQLSRMSQPAQPQVNEPMAEFDPETTNAVKRLAAQQASEILAQQRVAEFQAKHAAELDKDPLLKAAVDAQMREQAAKGHMIMPEKAFESAQKILNERLNLQAEKAKQEGVREGQDIAKTKQQLGAVGETGKQPEVTPEELSSSELAKRYNIPRIN